MNLEDIQAWVLSLVSASPALAFVPKIVDDGTYPKTPARESALNTTGLAIIIWEIDAESLKDFSRAGTASQEIYVPILVEENVSKNRTTGTQIPALAAVRHVQAALSGKKPNVASPYSLVPMDPPFKNFGRVNGVNTILVNFVIGSPINPI